MHVRRSTFKSTVPRVIATLLRFFEPERLTFSEAERYCKCARTLVQNKWTTAALEIQKYHVSRQEYKNRNKTGQRMYHLALRCLRAVNATLRGVVSVQSIL